MSRLFGPIRQNGYVVRDIEAAMKMIAGSARSMGIQVVEG